MKFTTRQNVIKLLPERYAAKLCNKDGETQLKPENQGQGPRGFRKLSYKVPVPIVNEKGSKNCTLM